MSEPENLIHNVTESEKYALLSNVPYLIRDGVPLDEIEKELEEFGLDHKIDRELSDENHATLTKDEDLVLSISGSRTLTHWIHNFIIMLNMPGLLESIAAKPHIKESLIDEYFPPFSWIKNIPELGKIPTQQIKYLKHGIKSMLSLSNPELIRKFEKWYNKHGPKSLNPEMRHGQDVIFTPLKVGYTVKIIRGMMTHILKNIESTVTASASGWGEDMISDRYEKLEKHYDKIKEKYPNKKKIVTGHSLGGALGLYISRSENIPGIVFNPAPQDYGKIYHKNHPQSKVYKTKYDFASYQRDEREKEPIVIIDQKIGNFLPEKEKRKQGPFLGPERKPIEQALSSDIDIFRPKFSSVRPQKGRERRLEREGRLFKLDEFIYKSSIDEKIDEFKKLKKIEHTRPPIILSSSPPSRPPTTPPPSVYYKQHKDVNDFDFCSRFPFHPICKREKIYY